MFRTMKTAGVIFALVLLSGCAASLKDFQEMGASARADYVCERHPDVVSASEDLGTVSRLVDETATVLANGYRTHQSCKRIPSVVPVTNCGGVYYYSCTTTTETVYNTVCETIPVAIDANLEKEKLQRYRSRHVSLGEKYAKDLGECRGRVLGMDAEAAFGYYEDIRGR